MHAPCQETTTYRTYVLLDLTHGCTKAPGASLPGTAVTSVKWLDGVRTKLNVDIYISQVSETIAQLVCVGFNVSIELIAVEMNLQRVRQQLVSKASGANAQAGFATTAT